MLASPRSPTTIRTGSDSTSRAKRSTFLRKVALNNRAVRGEITELGHSGGEITELGHSGGRDY